MRARGAQRPQNRLEHRFRTQQRIVITEAQHAKASTLEMARAFFIFDSTLHMLAAVQLDDQSNVQACEIDHVPPQRHLAPESIAAEPAVAQVMPEPAFGIGRVPAQSTCVFDP